MAEPRAIAVVGLGAILPDAPDVPTFWSNIQSGRYSISDVPPNRWREEFYFNPDPSVPDKTYTKIGGWVREFQFEPLKWKIPIPPKVQVTMDESQQWAIAACRQALLDYGYPERQLDNERVAVIFGNAMAGENHYRTSLRIYLPEYVEALMSSPAFQMMPEDVRNQLVQDMCGSIQNRIPEITEDTMPGELANIIAGRVANVFNFSGPNFVTDAACASSLAAIQAAIEGLNAHHYDAVLTGGVDRNMGVESFVKFCKIGALSPDGSRPYSDGANGFVMGEGTAIFLLKRLEDAERDGDKIYAVIRGIGSSSDGKGKGITAPNPMGQQRAIERAWKNAGVSPASVGLIEGHGTSTKVGDVVEVNSLNAIFGGLGLSTGSVVLGSVKSNIGHLKSAAGAAGMLKVVLALHEKKLPPTANFHRPNPNIDFAHMPFAVTTEIRPWEKPAGEIRRAGVSAFGFGGTNFHAVLEEYVPGLLTDDKRVFVSAAPQTVERPQPAAEPAVAVAPKPYRGLLVLGADDAAGLKARVNAALEDARAGRIPTGKLPSAEELIKTERLAVDFAEGNELVKRLEKALTTFELNSPTAWQALAGQGVYRGSGTPGKVAFMFPGQGSQYANMLRELADLEPVVRETYREADAVMTPILGRPLTGYIFADGDEAAIKQAEAALKDTTITQPAVLTANVAMMRLLEKYGFKPDMVIGHSLGEYAALVAAGVLTFAEALEVVSARGREMSKISVEDNGCMAAISAPLPEVERILRSVDGYVVIANINSPLQCVIAGATAAVDASVAAFGQAGYQAVKIPVSHAFHSKIVAPASAPLRKVIERMNVRTPQLPIAANVTGKLYPTTREEILDILADQVASPVQFIQGMETLYAEGARVFVEVGPKRVLNALAADIFKGRDDVTVLATNHPRKGALPSFNEALCGLYAAGVGTTSQADTPRPVEITSPVSQPALNSRPAPSDGRVPLTGSVVISGAGLGLPGRSGNVFGDQNIERILKGEMMIEPLPEESRREIVERKVTRLEKSDAGAVMVEIDDPEKTIKLAGQSGRFDPVEEFGIPAERVDSWDISTQLAVAAGIEALRDAGIPLVMKYRRTSKGTYLPHRWMLPEALADETGVIFGSAFPGLDRMAEELDSFYEHKRLTSQIAELESVLGLLPGDSGDARAALESRIAALKGQAAALDYHFNRHFVFRVLSMGHSQFAEYIGARGPNTHVNVACATTTHAIALAEDWIRSGRCRRVIVISGDNVSRGHLLHWIGTGMFASGASTIEGDVRKAALPFDRRRNGMIIGMGAAALVIESEDAVRERGMRGICEIIASQIANSAFHGTRLDVPHVASVMNRLLDQAEERFGIHRQEIAPQTVFVSHETYTPARGGSAAAEIAALRQTFGPAANQVVIANTKGFTGHSMGVGIEDVVAVKALEHGIVPPIAHYDDEFEPDPDLGDLNLSRGGKYPVQFALRLGAGFGSQIAMTLTRFIAGVGERIDRKAYDRWLAEVSGYNTAELEVVQRTLRIKQAGPPVREPAASKWRFGQGPTLWAAQPAAAAAAPRQPEAKPVEMPSHPVTPVVTTIVQKLSTINADLDAIQTYILSVVSEKTGYPTEMLDPELDLEGDLGIDTVKQAELFREIREHYGIPRREDLRLGDYNTLQKVAGFVADALAASVGQPAVEPPAAAVVVEPAAPVAAPAAPSAGASDIQSFVLGLVSEKTGYPAEMLDLDLDLEGDLGIDTVKQAELFRSVREHYGIPRREDLRLADYNTLAKVIQFVQEATGSGNAPAVLVSVEQSAPAAVESAPAAQTAVGADEDMKAYVLLVVSEKTGYPIEMLDLDLDLEGDLGIDTVKQAELFATIREHYNIPRREDLRLADYNTLAKVIQFMREAQGGQSAAAQPVSQPAAVEQPQEESKPVVVEQPAAAAAAPDGSKEEIRRTVLSVVAEKTGYPEEMLDLDLDLEGDLGIDTVKQAEIFATIRGKFDIPRREDLRLADYNTLEKVIDFMAEALQAKAQAVQAVEPTAAPATVEETEAESTGGEEEREIPRRVPVPVLRPRLDFCLPTGINFGPDSRVVIVSDRGKSADSLARRLRARKVQLLILTADSIDSVREQVRMWAEEGPVQGVYFLAGLDPEPGIREHTIETWRSEQERRLPVLAAILRELPDVSFLITATRMGGLHGYQTDGANAPLGGLSTGFTKAIGRERPGCFVKAVDFPADLPASQVAGRLVEETLRDPGAVEIGWEGAQRFAITLVERPYADEPRFVIEPGSVFLVSGGTGGITAPIVIDLARQTQGTFYLVSRTPLPERNDPDLQRVGADRNGLRKDLMARMSQEGKKVTPAQVETRLEALERAAATWKTIDAVEAAGGRAVYLAADVTDPQSVDDLIDKVLQAEGHVDVLVHAAGQDRSRKLENKPEDEFRRIVSVKADGFFFLFKALEARQRLPRAVVAFTSVAGRFGNSGQTDYSAANDLVCKLVNVIAREYRGLRAVAIDWGAWSEVGMASRGHIPELMRRAGIEMMSPAQAAPLVYRELVYGSGGEVVLAGPLGLLEEAQESHGGLDIEAANKALVEGEPAHVMLSRVTGLSLKEGVHLEAELDPSEPFLKDHALNGIPLLPGVLGIEGFSVAARHVASVLGSDKGGFRVDRLEDVRFLTPFKLYRNERRRITWKAQVVREEFGLVASVTLESTLALRARPAEVVRHFSGKVHLSPVEVKEDEPTVQPPEWNGAYTVQPEDIYRLYFHGPAFQVLDGVQRSGEGVLGRLRANLPGITDGDVQLITTPVLVELCLQTAGVWEIGATGAMALPRSIGSLKIYRPEKNGEPIFAEVVPSQAEDGEIRFDARVVDGKGRLYLELNDYRTVRLPYTVEQDLLAPLKGLVEN